MGLPGIPVFINLDPATMRREPFVKHRVVAGTFIRPVLIGHLVITWITGGSGFIVRDRNRLRSQFRSRFEATCESFTFDTGGIGLLLQLPVLAGQRIERVAQVRILTLRQRGLHFCELLLDEGTAILHLKGLTRHEILRFFQFGPGLSKLGFGGGNVADLRIGSPITGREGGEK